MSQSAFPNVICVDFNGQPLCPTTRKAFSSEEEYQSYLDAVIKGLEQHKSDRILIFVHGGLNSLRGAIGRASRLTKEMTEDGYYPLFLVWKSGLMTTYLEHLFFIRQGRISRIWGPVTFPFYLLADVGRGLTRLPISLFNQIVTDLISTVPRFLPTRMNALSLYSILRQRYESSSSAIAVQCGDDQQRGWAKLGRGLLYILTFIPQIIILPFLDAMGKSAWQSMLRRTSTMFHSPSEFDVWYIRNQPEKLEQLLDSSPSGAIAQAMDKIVQWADKEQSDPQFTLIGHSMGTIVLNEIVLRYPTLSYLEIIFLAAACSIRDFERSVIPYLQQHPKARFFNLCLHPLADAREIQWQFLDLPPRGSLLEWIDNFLSEPATSIDRTMGKWDNIIQATHVIPQKVRNRVYLKACGVGGPDDLKRHGELSERRFWSPEFWEISQPMRNSQIRNK